MKRIYFDYASTSPIDKDVLGAINSASIEIFGNPSSTHQTGQLASRAVFESKKIIAQALGVKYNEIIFTGSATEANNLAILGTYKYFLKNNKGIKPHIITTQTEHESVLETINNLPDCEISYIPTLSDGSVDLDFLTSSIKENTILVSVIMANNETGTILPIKKIADTIKEYKLKNSKKIYPLLHTDASQAIQFLDIKVKDLGVDLLTISGHKIYGPKGIGALYVNSFLSGNKIINAPIQPIIFGGEQEFGLRSGTEDVPKIIGFKKAVEINEKIKKTNNKKIREISSYFIKKIKKVFPDIEMNGLDMECNERIPNIVNIYIPKKDRDSLLIAMDLEGISASAGSACSSRANKESHVLKSMGLNNERIRHSIRFSFGKFTNKQEVDHFIKIIKTL